MIKNVTELTRTFRREIEGWYIDNQEFMTHAYNFLEDKWADAEVKLRAKPLIRQIGDAIHGTMLLKYGPTSMTLTQMDVVDIVSNEFVVIVRNKHRDAE